MEVPDPPEAVRAAGGVIVRQGRVLVVHRARYDDWSLPKGKLASGESWQAGALREVEEETGLRCVLGEEVGRSNYLDGRGRPKEVRFFLMSADGDPVAAHEIDAVAWVELTQAPTRLSYPSDRAVISALPASVGAGGSAALGADG